MGDFDFMGMYDIAPASRLQLKLGILKAPIPSPPKLKSTILLAILRFVVGSVLTGCSPARVKPIAEGLPARCDPQS